MIVTVGGQEYDAEDITTNIRAGFSKCASEGHLHPAVEIVLVFRGTGERVYEETIDAPFIFDDEADALEYANGWAQSVIAELRDRGVINYAHETNPN
jgi:hypothetical protein